MKLNAWIRLIAACAISSAGFLPASADGFEVVGLRNSAVRLQNPLDESAFLWMGDRIGSRGPAPELVRVDDQSILVLQSGEVFPRGTLLEFSEFSLFSASDTEISVWAGRVRLVNGTGGTSPGPRPISLRTAFGYFLISNNSVVDLDVTGQRMIFFCLAGEAAFFSGTEDTPLQVRAGHMVRKGLQGRVDLRKTPPDVHSTLDQRPYLQMRYSSSGPKPPRILWFSPQPGKPLDRDKVNLSGRVDLSDGPVDVSILGRPVSVQGSGLFSFPANLRQMQDSVSVDLKRDNSIGTLVVRTAFDLAPPDLRVDPVPETTRLPQVLLSGELNEPAVLFCSGRSVQIRDRKFSQMVDLSPGSNLIRLLAFDRSGNRREESFQVFRQMTASAPTDAAAVQTGLDSPVASPIPPPGILKSEMGEWGFVLSFEPSYLRGGRYRIHRSFSRDGPFVVIGETSDPSFTDLGPFDLGTIFFYRVSQIDPTGAESPMTDPVEFSPVAATPTPPDSIGCKIEGRKLSVFWSKHNPAEIAGYNVYKIDPAGSPRRVASLPAPPYVTDLPDTFTELFFRVSAISAQSLAESDWSDTLVVKK